MWRDNGLVLLLVTVTWTIVCAQDISTLNDKIVNVTIPRWIENGTVKLVILDCEYEYFPNETNFVVKWYFNKERYAAYQWIPSMNSRIFSDRFKKFVDWDHVLDTKDKFTRYRHMPLKRPTIEISGLYECSINSNIYDGIAEGRMDIYAPAKNITLVYNTLPDEQVNITCVVKRIFPKPDIRLLIVSSSDDPEVIEGTGSYTKDNGIDGFDITVNALISTYQLNSSEDTTFRCEVLIPDGVYKEEVDKVYHPSNEMAILEPLYENHNKPSSSSTSVIYASIVSIIFAILVL